MSVSAGSCGGKVALECGFGAHIRGRDGAEGIIPCEGFIREGEASSLKISERVLDLFSLWGRERGGR